MEGTVERVFIIDDDPDDIDLFTEALNEIAPAVKSFSANNSDEAIDRLHQLNPLPDLIFLDLNMPGLDGKQCLKLLKKDPKLAHIPVIIFSTSAFKKDIEESMELGASFFLTKPSSYRQTCIALLQVIMRKNH